MDVYSRNGDKGVTDLAHTKNVSKSDDRIRLMGTIDGLVSVLGLLRSMMGAASAGKLLPGIQETLLRVKAGTDDPYKREYRLSENCAEELEREMESLKAYFDYEEGRILPGGCRLSAQADLARAAARGAESELALVGVKFGADNGARQYLNRLSDYLDILARYIDAKETGIGANPKTELGPEVSMDSGEAQSFAKAPAAVLGDQVDRMTVNTGKMSNMEKAAVSVPGAGYGSAEAADSVDEAIVQAVLRRIGRPSRITLDAAKKLIEKIEQEAVRRGKKAVIAVCNPEGNPIAVHVMDGAFLVSFDVATKKAYTAVAVQMSTMELGKLAQPGGTFYGVDKLDGGRIVIFGGGVPLKIGDTIIGGLGVSGGTGEEDHSLAEYGLSVLEQVL